MSAICFQNPNSGYPLILWHNEKEGSTVEVDWDYAAEYSKPAAEDIADAKRFSALVKGEDFEGALSILKAQGADFS